MTTATQDGRRLRLDIEGLDPMWVEPLSARRGRYLTEEFVQAALGLRSQAKSAEIFIEALGPANFARIEGRYVVQHEEETGRAIAAYGSEGEITLPIDPALALVSPSDGELTARYSLHDELDGYPPLEGDTIRQEEGEELALCAFYWQTVVGMEAVRAFLDDGGGTSGSLKALALLQTRLGLSPVANSRSKGMESLIQQGVSAATNATGNSSGSVQLPAVRAPRDRLPKGLMGKARRKTQ